MLDDLKDYAGKLVVFTGPMFSSKTSNLLHFAALAEEEGHTVAAYKCLVDDRYGTDAITSHDQKSRPCEAVKFFHNPITADMVIVDEIQFFTWTALQSLRMRGNASLIMAAGLDLDFKGQPFDSTAHLLAVADDVVKLDGTCSVCQKPARFTQRIVDGEPMTDGEIVVVGGTDKYEARCRSCFVVSKESVLA